MAAGQRRFIGIQPISEWPGTRRSGVNSPFRAGFTSTLDMLEKELEHLGAIEPTIQTLHNPDDVRLDGRLKTDTRKPTYQGVILTFKRKAKQIEHACTRCKEGQRRNWTMLKDNSYQWTHPTSEQGKVFLCDDQNPKPIEFKFPADKYSDWKDNLRAVAMVLEGLRMIERHGVKSEAQYAGYKALPAASLNAEKCRHDAALVIKRFTGHTADFILEATNEELDSIYKKAARKAHPDAGGSATDFHQLTEAMRVLRAEV